MYNARPNVAKLAACSHASYRNEHVRHAVFTSVVSQCDCHWNSTCFCLMCLVNTVAVGNKFCDLIPSSAILLQKWTPTLFLCSGEVRFDLWIHGLQSNTCWSAEYLLPKNFYTVLLWSACGALWAELGLLDFFFFYPETINLHRYVTRIRIPLSERLSCLERKYFSKTVL